MLKNIIPLLFYLLPILLFGQDYYIIENPRGLKILNKYQQEISTEALRSLPEFAPFRIITEDDTLSDGFRTYKLAEYDGADYYLLTNDIGEFIAEAELGFTKRIKDAEKKDFEAVILLDDKVNSFSPDGKRNERLIKNTRLRVFFKDGSRYYARNITDHNFCFVNLSIKKENTDWQIAGSEAATIEISEHVVNRIKERIDQVNLAWFKLYGLFSEKTGNKKEAPYWEMEAGKDSLVCSLLNRGEKDSVTDIVNLIYNEFSVYCHGGRTEHLPR